MAVGGPAGSGDERWSVDGSDGIAETAAGGAWAAIRARRGGKSRRPAGGRARNRKTLAAAALADAVITPGEGEAIARIVDTFVRAIETSDFERRLKALEGEDAADRAWRVPTRSVEYSTSARVLL